MKDANKHKLTREYLYSLSEDDYINLLRDVDESKFYPSYYRKKLRLSKFDRFDYYLAIANNKNVRIRYVLFSDGTYHYLDDIAILLNIGYTELVNNLISDSDIENMCNGLIDSELGINEKYSIVLDSGEKLSHDDVANKLKVKSNTIRKWFLQGGNERVKSMYYKHIEKINNGTDLESVKQAVNDILINYLGEEDVCNKDIKYLAKILDVRVPFIQRLIHKGRLNEYVKNLIEQKTLIKENGEWVRVSKKNGSENYTEDVCYYIDENGVKWTVDKIASEFGVERGAVCRKVAMNDIEKVYLSYKFDTPIKLLKYVVILDDGSYINYANALILLGCTAEQLTKKFKQLGRDKYAELVREDINKLFSAHNNVPIKINVCGIEFPSLKAASDFLNTNFGNVYNYYKYSRIHELEEVYHVRERILFKENSPYSTWFADDTWIYKCPVCKRKLLMSTEELINYKHDDALCIEFEIE